MSGDLKDPSRDRKLRAAVMLSVLLMGGQDAAAGSSAAGVQAAGVQAAGMQTELEVVPSMGHFRQVERIVYSPDGQWLISSSDRLEGTTRVWRDGRLRHVLRGTMAVMAPDGETVLTATEGTPASSGAVRRYRVASGEQLWEAASATVSSLAVTADGARVVAACDDGVARVWDLETGELLRSLEGRAAWLGQLALSADSSLAATSHRMTVSIWSLRAGKHSCQLQGHGRMISGLAFAADGSYLASSDHGGVVRLWDPATCRTQAVLQGDSERLEHLALSPDGKVLLAAGGKAAWMWDVEAEELLSSYSVEGESISAVAFDRRGEWVAIGHGHGLISLLKPGQERPYRTLRSRFGLSWIEPSPAGDELAAGHFGIDLIPLASMSGTTRLKNFKRHIDGVQISDDGSQVITQSYKTIRIWDLETGRPPIELDGSRVMSSSGGAVVVVGEHERSDGIRIWHRDTRMILDEAKHGAVITAFDLDPGGTLLATGAADGTVRLWDARTGDQLRQLVGPSSVAYDVVLIEDAGAVVASYPDGSLWVWETDTSTLRHVLYHPESQRTWHMWAVPSTSLVLTNVVNGGTYLWDLTRGGISKRLFENFVSIAAAAFTPDGQLVLSLSHQPAPGVWSGESGRLLFSLRGHRAPVEGIALLDHGRQIVTGAGDGTLGWWRAVDGERRQLLPSSRSGITAVAASSSGDLLLTGDRDGAVRIRHAADGDEIVRLLSSPVGGWAVVTPDGRWDASQEGRDSGFTVWSGRHYSMLADHHDRHVPGLLARVVKPHIEAGRSAQGASEAAAPPPGDVVVAEPPPGDPPPPSPAADADTSPPTPNGTSAEPWPLPPSLRALEASARGAMRPVKLGFLTERQVITMHVDGPRVAIVRATGGQIRLRVGDLSHPPEARWLAELEIPGGATVGDWWRGFLYLARGGQLMVIDARDAANTRLAGKLPVAAVAGLDADDGRLYLAGECDGLQVLDLERPERPSPLPAGPNPDAFGCLKSVAARGRYVYATAADSNISSADSAFVVIDVSDPAAPQLIGRTLYSRGARRDVTRFAVEGQHAFLAADDLGLLIFDLSNPAVPEEVARIDTPGLTDVAVVGDCAYLADTYLGLHVLDIETPSDPRYLGGDARAPEVGLGPRRLAVSGEHVLVRSQRGVRILRLGGRGSG